MEAKLMDRIKEQLVRHEGLRLKPYRCTAGKLTIGIGRNLDDCGITQSEAYVMLINDIMNCEKQLQAKIPDIYNGLDEVRKSMLLNMCISIPQSRFAPLREPCYLGIGGLLELNNTLAFVKQETGNGMLTTCLSPSGLSRLAAERLSYLR